MFSKQDFQHWGKTEVVLFASVATHIKGRKDDALLREYGFRGFPSFAILDSKGEAITKKINRDLGSMQTAVSAATEYVKLEAAVAAGKKVDQSKLFLARLGLGKLSVQDAKRQLSALQLSAKRKIEIEAQLFTMELQGLRRYNADRAGAKVYEFYKAGKKPAAGSKLTNFYNSALLRGAENERDAKAYLYAYPLARKVVARQAKSVASALERTTNQRTTRRYKSQLARLQTQMAYMDTTANEFKKASAGSGDASDERKKR